MTDYFQRKGVIPKFYFIVDRLDLLIQAQREFAGRGLVIGLALAEVLPELPPLGSNDRIIIDGKAYQCLWRQVSLGGTAYGQLLMLQREEK